MNPARRLAPCGEHATLWTSAAVMMSAAIGTFRTYCGSLPMSAVGGWTDL